MNGRGACLSQSNWADRPLVRQFFETLQILRAVLGHREGWDGVDQQKGLQWFLALPSTHLRAILTPDSDLLPEVQAPTVDAREEEVVPAPAEGSPPGEGAEGPGPGFVCDDCQATFTSRKALAGHRRLKHGDRDLRRDLVHDNKCPACGRVFSDTREARRHFGLKKCPQSRDPRWDALALEQGAGTVVAVAEVRASRGGRGRGRGAFRRL